MIDRKINSFPPLINKNSKILILGTSPSKKSEEKNFYYANISHNAFWEIMNDAFGITIPNDRETAISYKQLLNHNIALWDVNSWNVYKKNSCKDCDIIVEGPTNNIKALLEQTNIKLIILNGYKAFYQFKKVIKNKFSNFPKYLWLESTAAGWSHSSRIKTKVELKKIWIQTIKSCL